MREINLTKRAMRKKAVLWHVAGGWLSNLIHIVQGLLLIPLYIYYLGDRLYGFWLATGGILAWISMVDFGASAITLQRCAAAFGRKDFALIVQYFWHGAVIMYVMLILFLMSFLTVGFFIPSWLDIDPVFQSTIINCYYVTSVAVMLHLINEFLKNVAVALQRNHIPVFAQTLGDLVCLFGVIFALVVLQIGLWALVLGMLLRTFIPLVINLIHTVQILRSIKCRNRWSVDIFKDYMMTTPVVCAAKASGQFAQHLPSVLIARFIGPEATVAYTITMRAVLMVQSFINHALSGLYGACSHYFHDPSVGRNQQLRTISQLAQGYCIIAGLGTLLYALLNHGFVAVWTSDQYFGGQMFTCLAALAAFIQVRNSFFVGLGISFGEIRATEFTQFLEQMLRICLIVLGIYSLGILGVPIAILISGLATQYRYAHIFRSRDASIMKALSPLMWQWGALALLLWPIYNASDLFVVGDWTRFIAYAACIIIPAAVLMLLMLPGVRYTSLRSWILNYIPS